MQVRLVKATNQNKHTIVQNDLNVCWLFFKSQDWSDWWNFASTCHWWAQKPVTLVGSHVIRLISGLVTNPSETNLFWTTFTRPKMSTPFLFHDLRGRGSPRRYPVSAVWWLTQEVFNLESNAEGTVSLRSYLDFHPGKALDFFTKKKGMKITRFKGFKDIFFLMFLTQLCGENDAIFFGQIFEMGWWANHHRKDHCSNRSQSKTWNPK